VRLCRALGGWLSPAGSRAALSILIFHRVVDRPDPLFPEEPDAARFDAILGWLGRTFNVLPLAQALDALRAGSLPSRAVSITFDDGYADNVDVALPALLRHRMHATFFIASAFLDGGRMWNDTVIEAVRRLSGQHVDLTPMGMGRHAIATARDRRRVIDLVLPALKYLPPGEREARASMIADLVDEAIPGDLMMTSSQLRKLRSAGMDIGGHTRSHPILARLDAPRAREEIAGGKADLESIIGERVRLFAYPNGKPGRDYHAAHVAMVRDAGFAAAVSTSSGAARRTADLYQLPRFTPWDRTELRFALRLVDNMRVGGRVAA
jgi:peptidoglycan/xylan/chitin deacetylase (PgdA/CDA1 family)